MVFNYGDERQFLLIGSFQVNDRQPKSLTEMNENTTIRQIFLSQMESKICMK